MNVAIDDVMRMLSEPNDSRPLLPDIRQELRKSDCSLVVLDDDPTGTQTVHDVPVLTVWTDDAIEKIFEAKTPIFYLLTNSRALHAHSANQLAEKIGKRLKSAGKKYHRKFFVISRSDSTLRGHYPHEVDALADGLETNQLLKIIIPAFFEGNRITVNDIHYVAEGEELIPVSETPYADDKTFGYKNSNLKIWIEEKTNARIKSEDVYSFSLESLRSGGVSFVIRQLNQLPSGSTCIVNAISQHDLDIFALGLLRSDVPFLARSAASFVVSIGGISKKTLLSRREINPDEKMGALWIVGSYVPKTTDQLLNLLDNTGIRGLEIDVTKVLDKSQTESIIRDAAYQINTGLANGKNMILYTSRRLIASEDKEASLAIGNQISRALTTIVSCIVERPAYMLVKGGITSSDIATKSLKIHKARVMGQIIPGVPVWELGDEARFPGLAYIVYPGNVGDRDALINIYNQLTPDNYE